MLINTITSRVGSLYSGALQKSWAAIALWPVTLLAPIMGGLFALLTLVFIDLVLGVWKAIKQSNFSAARLRTGTYKFITYTMAIITVRIVETLLPVKGITYVADFTILFLAVTELISILETLTILGVNIPSPVLQFFKKQVDIKSIIKK